MELQNNIGLVVARHIPQIMSEHPRRLTKPVVPRPGVGTQGGGVDVGF